MRVQYRRANQVYEDVIGNVVDLGIVAYPTRDSKLEIFPLRKEPLVLICHPQHPLAKNKTLKLKNLAGIKFTSGNLMEYQLCQAFRDGAFDLPYGFDEQMLPALALGATGAVGSGFNFAAPIYWRLLAAFAALTGRISLESVAAAIREKFPAKVAEANVAAANVAHSLVVQAMQETARAQAG